jgi:hypothetical protein
MSNISRQNLARARSLAEALFSTEAGPPPADRLDRATEAFGRQVYGGGLRTRLLFCVALHAIGWIAPLLILRMPTAWRLPWRVRVAAISRMEDSGFLAAPVMLCKAILCLVYYEEPGAAEEVGHVGVGFWEKPPAGGAA